MRTPHGQDDDMEQSSDVVTLRVVEHSGSDPLMDTAFAEDIRYWSDGTEEPVGDERVFLSAPRAPSFIPVENESDVGLGQLLLPESWLEKIGVPWTPIEMEFVVVRPQYNSQLERRY